MTTIQSAIAPWLSVNDPFAAIDFYKLAFGAQETYRMETPDGLIVRLSMNGAEFWISGNSSDNNYINSQPLGANTIRMILTVPNPDELFAQAIEAGAKEIFPVGDDHGWRLGRLEDPFGLHWEIGYEL